MPRTCGHRGSSSPRSVPVQSQSLLRGPGESGPGAATRAGHCEEGRAGSPPGPGIPAGCPRRSGPGSYKPRSKLSRSTRGESSRRHGLGAQLSDRASAGGGAVRVQGSPSPALARQCPRELGGAGAGPNLPAQGSAQAPPRRRRPRLAARTRDRQVRQNSAARAPARAVSKVKEAGPRGESFHRNLNWGS